jgi:cytochrome c biogenesis protein CcmG/thiol:disulfide interchange protein DsbE
MTAQENKTNYRYLFPLLAFLFVAALLGVGLTLNPRDLPSTLIDKPAPAFALQQLQNTQSTFSPSDLKGQRWLFNVWASWCVGCRVEHPLLNQLAQRTDIIMVGLNYKDDPDEARAWLAERGNPYSIIPMDIEGDVGIDYGVYGVPETFVIDEQGTVIYKHTGPLTAKAVEQDLLPLFNTPIPSVGMVSQ